MLDKSKRFKVYVSGPITGVPAYWEAFEEAEEQLQRLGLEAILPSRLPQSLSNKEYVRINFAFIDAADAVYLLPNWKKSPGARLERDYSIYTDTPVFDTLGELEAATWDCR